MIITFATQKGGTGKTTLAIAFANYLSIVSERSIKVYDFDFQKSFYSNGWMMRNRNCPNSTMWKSSARMIQNRLSDLEEVIELKESENITSSIWRNT
jgi:chromosome partitioning protein